MKRIFILLLFFMNSCALLNIDNERAAYHLGRATTVAYIVAKKNVDEKYIESINKVWTAFDENIENVDSEQLCVFDEVLKEKIKESTSNKKINTISNALIDRYWKKINDRFDMSQDNIEDKKVILLSFRDGIKSAIEDYLEGDKDD